MLNFGNYMLNFGIEKRHLMHSKGQIMWLDNLKELKKQKGLSSKQIAEKANLPERTVSRIFSGDTPNPYVDTLYRITVILDGSLDDVLADSKTVVGSANLATLQTRNDELQAEIGVLRAELDLAKAENAIAKDKIAILTTENDLLRMKLEHKDEIIAIHNYYNKINS